MSKTDADIRRRERDMLVKPIRCKGQIEEDTYFHKIPDDGCPYYGDAKWMAAMCPWCVREECY